MDMAVAKAIGLPEPRRLEHNWDQVVEGGGEDGHDTWSVFYCTNCHYHTEPIQGRDRELQATAEADRCNSPCRYEREFHPSTNLDDAFEAAEMAGLFSPRRGDQILYQESGGKWVVSRTEYIDDATAFADRPSLAICRAILKTTEAAGESH